MRSKKGSSLRAKMIARWFDVNPAEAEQSQAVALPSIDLRGGQIVLLSGPSGAGKSSLLRAIHLAHQRRVRWIDLQHIVLPREQLVIDVMAEELGGGADEETIVSALQFLSRVGLGEVWTYLRTPGQLSDGQRWRLRLAIALARGEKLRNTGILPVRSHKQERLKSANKNAPRPRAGSPCYDGVVLAADEFAAPLDRITALVVARALRKAVTAHPNLCAIVATTRDDLLQAIQPDINIRCDFGTCNISHKGELS